MASKKSAVKRHKQSIERRERNRSHKSRTRTAQKKLLTNMGAGAAAAQPSADTAASLMQVIKLLDTGVSKGVFHKNTAARKKSRLVKKFNALGK